MCNESISQVVSFLGRRSPAGGMETHCVKCVASSLPFSNRSAYYPSLSPISFFSLQFAASPRADPGKDYTHWLRAEVCKNGNYARITHIGLEPKCVRMDQGVKMEFRVWLGVKPVWSILVLSKIRSWVSFW